MQFEFQFKEPPQLEEPVNSATRLIWLYRSLEGKNTFPLDVGALPANVRRAMLESARLAQNALDQFVIYGPEGFETAFKGMFGELLATYMQGGSETRDADRWNSASSFLFNFDTIATKLVKHRKPLADAAQYFGALTGG